MPSKYVYHINGTEKRCCSIEGCGWCDMGGHYGAYVNGEYFCSKHGDEFVFVNGKWVRDGDNAIDFKNEESTI